MEIIFIQNIEQFNEIYCKFKETSLINKNPKTFLIGLDCEFVMVEKNKTYNWIYEPCDNSVLCKLQIANSKMCLVIDLCMFNKVLPNKLEKILQKKSWIKTGINIDKDMKILSTCLKLGFCSGHIDLETIFTLKGISNPSLENCAELFNLGIQKLKHENNNWDEPMNIQDIQYCANDAIISYKLGEKLFSSLNFNIKLPNTEIKVPINLFKIKSSKDNFINMLQEYAQKNKLSLPSYDSSENNGEFIIVCTFLDKITDGKGNNKKTAKMIAAQKMYELIFN